MNNDFIKNVMAFLPLKLEYWPLWLFLSIPFIIKLVKFIIDNWKKRNSIVQGDKWRSDRDLLQWLRGMKPSEFENFIAGLFSRLGFKTQSVGRSHDGGIDVIIEKNGVISYIQCKKFITSQVSVNAVRDFYGALADRLANSKGYFITTNKFTLEAERFAEDKPIELIDGFRLIEYIRKTEKVQADTARNNVGNKCPRCGGDLVERFGKFGSFQGCKNYPKCKYTVKKS